MAIFDEITGIGVASGFKLQAQVPLDVRTVVDSTDDLSALIEENGAYEGMVVYVKSEDALYALKGTSADDWIKIMDALQTEFTEKLTLSVVDALPESSVSYDFEDGVSLFTTPMIGTTSKGTSSVAADETTGNRYQSIKVSDTATIGSSSNVLSKLDFSSTSENATDLTVEFDFQFVDNGRMRIALCDLDVQDAKTGNIRYDFDGFAADIWSSSNNQFLINSSGSKHASFFGAWLHARFDIDFSTNTFTYKIVNNDDSSDYLSGTKAFHGDCTKVTGIIVYTWNPGDELYIDNIEITARTEPTDNTLYGIEDGDLLNTYVYVDGKAMEIGGVVANGAGLADGEVTTPKLADSSVTGAKIHADAVTSAKIYAGAVTEAKIADGAVTEDKLADGAVTEAKLDESFANSLCRVNYYQTTASNKSNVTLITPFILTNNSVSDGIVNTYGFYLGYYKVEDLCETDDNGQYTPFDDTILSNLTALGIDSIEVSARLQTISGNPLMGCVQVSLSSNTATVYKADGSLYTNESLYISGFAYFYVFIEEE